MSSSLVLVLKTNDFPQNGMIHFPSDQNKTDIKWRGKWTPATLEIRANHIYLEQSNLKLAKP